MLELLLRLSIEVLMHYVKFPFQFLILCIIIADRIILVLFIQIILPHENKQITVHFVQLFILNLTFVLLKSYLSVLCNFGQEHPQLILYWLWCLRFVLLKLKIKDLLLESLNFLIFLEEHLFLVLEGVWLGCSRKRTVLFVSIQVCALLI